VARPHDAVRINPATSKLSCSYNELLGAFCSQRQEQKIANIVTTTYTTPTGLKKLNLRDRNKVRSILAQREEGKAIELLNRLRQRSPWQELLQIERALRTAETGFALPELFPRAPQTEEKFNRLSTISVVSQLNILNALALEHRQMLSAFCEQLQLLNESVVRKNAELSNQRIHQIFLRFGYSHLILRKAALVKSFCGSIPTPEIDLLLEAAGLDRSNIVCTSLVQCYQEEPDYLTLKRSILNLARRGLSNRFTRDTSRLAFHAHARNESDFANLLQSSLQSSLIDAYLLIKVNRERIGEWHKLGVDVIALLEALGRASPSLDAISEMYLAHDDAEDLFVKQASAWYECSEIVEARHAIDHFFDAPEANYLEISDVTVDRVGKWLMNISLENLIAGHRFTNHMCEPLSSIESKGFCTRSAAFNYRLWRSEGFEQVSEQGLFDLMGVTRDLSKTSYVPHLRNLANSNASEGVKLIVYLLIAKRSRNERDDHRLRHIFQNIAIAQFDGSVLSVISSLSERSVAVAEFAYEVCTEDFIAKLSRITKSAAQITETRAALHHWMWEKTKNKVYFDRARTILIDHQINRVRNEIDDNRIYVDAGRLSEWVNDELVAELNALFGSLQKNILSGKADAPQLIGLISRCYTTFCQNQVFGMASYLGRRIRHGTFKGHLFYSTVSALESRAEFQVLKNDPGFAVKWPLWKKQFESSIDQIIKERLHVESPTKKNGFLRTGIETPEKYEIALGCAKNIVQEYLATNSTATAASILIDYCWRLAEVDLRAFNVWLKGQKTTLLNLPKMDELKASVRSYHRSEISGFQREIVSCVQEKLNGMSSWFKRPPSVSPKASLSLLFRAVVAEVKESFPGFQPAIDDTGVEIELFGGAYHVIYDSFYVAVFNAAKHGRNGGLVGRNFYIEKGTVGFNVVVCEITSELNDWDSEAAVSEKLKVAPDELDSIENAQIFEGRSGIRKLHQLVLSDDHFSIRHIKVENRKVSLAFAYELR
jgi:hypothetical protein